MYSFLWTLFYQAELSTGNRIEEVDDVLEEEGHRDVQQLGAHQQAEGDEDSFLYHRVVCVDKKGQVIDFHIWQLEL